MKNFFTRIFIVFLFYSVNVAALNDSPLASSLGWIIQPNNSYNICNGYYRELPIPYVPNPKAVSQSDNYDILSDHVFYSLKGESILTGHVQLIQPDSQITADKAYIYPDKKTNRPSQIKLFGHVHMRQPQKLILGSKADLDLKNKVKTIYDAHYRMVMIDSPDKTMTTKKGETRYYELNAVGDAKKLKEVKPGYIILRDASYSTCPPTSHVWAVKGSTIKLNQETGRGEALNTRLLIQRVPVFYLPYFNFPIDHKRHTGFLYPSLGFSSDDGMTLTAPFYLNLAPNYDATITPSWISYRGVLMDGLFRYLTPDNTGEFSLGYLPHDQEFKGFKKEAEEKYVNDPSYHRLANASYNRQAFAWDNEATYDEHWTSELHYNYVGDDYYQQDFDTDLMDVSNNQLLRQAKVNYYNDNWNFLGNLQSYQTLHQVGSITGNQYAKLPQLQLNADYPDQPLGLEYDLASEFVRFDEARVPGGTDPTVGDRMALEPGISLPMNWPYAFITPEMKLQTTKYRDLENTKNDNPANPGIAIPIFDVKTGLYFDRSTTLFQHEYRQTLEPVIYYLYVPYQNQNRFPIFDTSVQSFSFSTMFSDNRFTGYDRVGDANQVSAGLTTRFIDDDTGDQKAILSLGQIRYFKTRRVLLYSGSGEPKISPIDKRVDSPIAASGGYNFNPVWSLTGDAAWNNHDDHLDSASTGINYKPDVNHLLNLSYDFSRGGDTISGVPKDSDKNNLRQTNLTGFWRLSPRWSFMGKLNYNWSHHNFQSYFYGLSYDSCCWAVRFIQGRTFLGDSPYNINRVFDDYRYRYKDVFYLQFALKGLGKMGRGGDATGFLTQNITNYVDKFGEVS